MSLSLHLNTFKSYKYYLVRYKDIRTFNCTVHFIKRVSCDNKITLVSFESWVKTIGIYEVISSNKKY